MRVVGINGGNGVILHPFKKHLICNFEQRGLFHTKKNEQWYSNFHQPIFKNRREFEDYIYGNRIDVIIGAPDCGHSSVLALSRGKKLTDPKDNDSLMTYIDCVKTHKPKLFLMENLPAMLKNVTKEWLEQEFKGYKLIYICEPVTFFGNSQTKRVRLVLIGIKLKYVERFKDLLSNHPKKFKLKSTKELLKGIPDYPKCTGHYREDEDKLISMYHGDKNRLPVREVKKLWKTNFKGSRRWVVNRNRMKNQPGVYRNLKNQTPLTVTKGDRQFNPNGYPMTPRELARIQGVPDSFKIYTEQNNLQYWINKGRITVAKTPPYEVGLWLYAKLYGH